MTCQNSSGVTGYRRWPQHQGAVAPDRQRIENSKLAHRHQLSVSYFGRDVHGIGLCACRQLQRS
jgi:hypothetical protein